MKIVFNTDQVYLHGGIEKVMATKANYLVNQPDTEVYIVTTEQKDHIPCYPLDKKIKILDLGVNYNRVQSYFSWNNIKKALQHYRRQTKLFRELKPDVIISLNFNFDFYWLPFVCKKAKKIKEIHSSRYNWHPSLRNRLNTWFEKKYDTVVVLNKDEADYFKSDNIVIIPNPVEENERQCVLEKKQVIAAGRIAPVKGFDDLIKAWKEVYLQFPDWELHIYGQDYLGTQKQLQDLIHQYALDEVVLFKGSVGNLTEVMCDYSIYAMSSVTECFPMVLLEALSVGLPVVSYDCPNGPRNITTQGQDGYLAEPQNVIDLADKLISLIENEEQRKQMGRQGKINVQRFAREEVMKKWMNLIRS